MSDFNTLSFYMKRICELGIEASKTLAKMNELKKEHTLKPVIFTTEDGENIIYDYQRVYAVNNAWETLTVLGKRCIEWQSECRDDFKYFHSKEKAEEYILMNKPCLSLEDLLSVWYKGDSVVKTNEQYMTSPLFQDFKELAKSKMK